MATPASATDLEGSDEGILDIIMPPEKRPRSDTSRHVVCYKKQWEVEFPWLLSVMSNGSVTGMMCSLCKRHHTKNKCNQSTVWSTNPCICLRKDSIRRHSLSAQHQTAVELEKARLAAQQNGGIQQVLQSGMSLQKNAVKGGNAVSLLVGTG